jgi:Domain of unknown function (DUF397)
MLVKDFSQAAWRKSSRSGFQSDCVEVAFSNSQVGIRDSKNPEGSILVVDPSVWKTFIRIVH